MNDKTVNQEISTHMIERHPDFCPVIITVSSRGTKSPCWAILKNGHCLIHGDLNAAITAERTAIQAGQSSIKPGEDSPKTT